MQGTMSHFSEGELEASWAVLNFVEDRMNSPDGASYRNAHDCIAEVAERYGWNECALAAAQGSIRLAAARFRARVEHAQRMADESTVRAIDECSTVPKDVKITKTCKKRG